MNPQPLVTCPTDKVGTDDVRWSMMTAVLHRQRDNRVEAARKVIRSRSKLISKEQRLLMHSIIDGRGDMILQKLTRFGVLEQP